MELPKHLDLLLLLTCGGGCHLDGTMLSGVVLMNELVKDSQILTRFNPPLQLKEHKTYEMALVNLETYYSIPNIHAGNNSFRYSPDDGANWFPIALSTGSYGINNISEEIQRQMQINKHKAKIILDANRATLRATLTLAIHYQVDFNVDNSLSTVLGFECQVYTYQIATNGYAEGEHIVNIISIDILVDCDIIHGSYVNGTQQSTIYSFFPGVDPGEKIIQTPKNLVYLPVTLKTISRMQTNLTDQDGRPIDIRGEHLTIRFHLREV
ncbi:unnamed protein product [Mytilus edulis]|uniref:Uncharacterized protein n=1 Tax=Mytilus edulis TaxID=6550 RepID=A0A8S3Q631_MYTED|nr:unnamed protein product [Mytilus edulis]